MLGNICRRANASRISWVANKIGDAVWKQGRVVVTAERGDVVMLLVWQMRGE